MKTQFIKLPQLKALCMAAAKSRFGTKFTRFAGPEWAAYWDDRIRNESASWIRSMPSVGKTVLPPVRQAKPVKETP